MKIYLAAQYARRDELKAMIPELESEGFFVTSRWLQENGNLNGRLTNSPKYINAEFAARDLEDIDNCDELILFSEDPLSGIPRGARHVELGYALGIGKRVSVIGPRENIFHFLPTIQIHDDLESWMTCAAKVKALESK